MIEAIPYILGIIVVGVSIFTIWVNHLKPFTLKASIEKPRIRLYKVGKKEGKVDFLEYGDVNIDKIAKLQTQALEEEKNYDYVYWIPAIAFLVSFYNDGKKTGLIKKILAILTLKSSKKPNKFSLYAMGIFKNHFKKHPFNKNRDELHDELVEKDWSPIFLSSHETKKCISYVKEEYIGEKN